MQPALTRTLVRTRLSHFRGFLLLDLRQCALRFRAGAVFLFNPERNERVGRKYRARNNGEGNGWKDIISVHEPSKIEERNIQEEKIPPEIGYVRKESRTSN